MEVGKQNLKLEPTTRINCELTPVLDSQHDEGDDICVILDCDSGASGRDEDYPCELLSSPRQISAISRQIEAERKDKWPRLTQAAATINVLKPYIACQAAGTHNVLGPRIEIKTGIKIEAWTELATGHPDDQWLIQCLRYGFPMQYRGPPIHNKFTSNHPSAINFPDHVNKYIKTEIGHGAIVGPFQEPPFHPWCNVAPLMTRPKANKNERRVIVDLSFPPDSGPNSHIAKNCVFGRLLSHVLPTVQDAIKIITTLGFNVNLCSVDIARAYRNFVLDPYDWPLACIYHDGSFYIDRAMPFGSRLSSLYMQRLAAFIQRALLRIDILTVIYLDDALVISRHDQDPEEGFTKVRNLLNKIGLPIAWEKLVPPTRCIRFLGIIIDLHTREVRMPEDKIEKFLSLIDEIEAKRGISKKTMQSIVGYVNHVGKAVTPARLFMNRLLHALREATGNYIIMSDQVKRDLYWFKCFLKEYNGRLLIVGESPSITIEADSCLSGGGAWTGARCYSYVYPDEIQRDMHISQLEAYNCLIAARVFLRDAAGVCVQIVCDNESAISCLSTGRGRDPIIMSVCRAFWYFAARRDIRFVFTHAPGTSMAIADALSRSHLSDSAYGLACDLATRNRLRFVDVHPEDCDYLSFV